MDTRELRTNPGASSLLLGAIQVRGARLASPGCQPALLSRKLQPTKYSSVVLGIAQHCFAEYSSLSTLKHAASLAGAGLGI